MAEVQTHTESGEMTQRFVQFVMMQSQNAALFLGQLPNPHGETPEINLDVAKMFIDQLVMIRSKTKGNLSTEEMGVLNNAISNLQMAFYEVSQKQSGAETGGTAAPEPAEAKTAPASDAPDAKEPVAEASESEPRKKFSKSYGAS